MMGLLRTVNTFFSVIFLLQNVFGDYPGGPTVAQNVQLIGCNATTATLTWEHPEPYNPYPEWMEDGENVIDRYILYIAMEPDGKYSGPETEYIYLPADETRVDINLADYDDDEMYGPGAEYTFKILAQWEYGGYRHHYDTQGIMCSNLAPAPQNVEISCKSSSAVISWEHGSDDVLEYIVSYWYGPGYREEPEWRAPGDATSIEIDLIPGMEYRQLMIRAMTVHGRSKKIWTDDGCVTDPAPPSTNPKNVCAAEGGKDELVVVWEPIDYLYLNGDLYDFYYKLSYKPEKNASPTPEPISIWWGYGTYNHTIDGLTYGDAYEVTLESENAQGMATEGPAKAMLMHVGMAGCKQL